MKLRKLTKHLYLDKVNIFKIVITGCQCHDLKMWISIVCEVSSLPFVLNDYHYYIFQNLKLTFGFYAIFTTFQEPTFML